MNKFQDNKSGTERHFYSRKFQRFDTSVKPIAIIAAACIAVSILSYILISLKNGWSLAREPSAMAHFGSYLSGTVGVLLAFLTLCILILSMIAQKQDNNDAIRANTKAFVLNEYRAAIAEVKHELERKNKSFSYEQEIHAGSDKSMVTTTNLWDFFHGCFRSLSPGFNPELHIEAVQYWNDQFDTGDAMDVQLRTELHHYAIKISKLRYLIIRYLEEGGLPDLFLEELDDARLSKQFLEGPVKSLKGTIIPSKVTKSVVKVYQASCELINEMEKALDKSEGNSAN